MLTLSKSESLTGPKIHLQQSHRETLTSREGGLFQKLPENIMILHVLFVVLFCMVLPGLSVFDYVLDLSICFDATHVCHMFLAVLSRKFFFCLFVFFWH